MGGMEQYAAVGTGSAGKIKGLSRRSCLQPAGLAPRSDPPTHGGQRATGGLCGRSGGGGGAPSGRGAQCPAAPAVQTRASVGRGRLPSQRQPHRRRVDAGVGSGVQLPRHPPPPPLSHPSQPWLVSRRGRRRAAQNAALRSTPAGRHGSRSSPRRRRPRALGGASGGGGARPPPSCPPPSTSTRGVTADTLPNHEAWATWNSAGGAEPRSNGAAGICMGAYAVLEKGGDSTSTALPSWGVADAWTRHGDIPMRLNDHPLLRHAFGRCSPIDVGEGRELSARHFLQLFLSEINILNLCPRTEPPRIQCTAIPLDKNTVSFGRNQSYNRNAADRNCQKLVHEVSYVTAFLLPGRGTSQADSPSLWMGHWPGSRSRKRS